jgi:hypothetical protein
MDEIKRKYSPIVTDNQFMEPFTAKQFSIYPISMTIW